MLFCNVPFATAHSLARIFQILNRNKEEKSIETYALSQTTLEQIFVQLAGEDEEASADRRIESRTTNEQSKSFSFRV
jgi:hypothetical protein